MIINPHSNELILRRMKTNALALKNKLSYISILIIVFDQLL